MSSHSRGCRWGKIGSQPGDWQPAGRCIASLHRMATTHHPPHHHKAGCLINQPRKNQWRKNPAEDLVARKRRISQDKYTLLLVKQNRCERKTTERHSKESKEAHSHLHTQIFLERKQKPQFPYETSQHTNRRGWSLKRPERTDQEAKKLRRIQ